jgi:Phosphate-selective porin O and P
MFIKNLLVLCLCIASTFHAFAQKDSVAVKPAIPTDKPVVIAKPTATPIEPAKPVVEVAKKWYDILSFKGYGIFRYNRLLETNPKLKCEQCDKSIGENGGLAIRSARLEVSGNVHPRVFVLLEADFTASPSATAINYAQLKKAYVDIALDSKKEFRVVIGQSIVPFGYDNMLSTTKNIAFDRSDAINSAAPGEAEVSTMFYWTPEKVRGIYSDLSNLRGLGNNYGVFGFGVYNGQSFNKPEIGNSLHVVGRVSYPIALGEGQFIEPSVQAYTGKYTVASVTSGVKGINKTFEYDDQRVAGSVILYPKPFGLIAEYIVGTGPQYDPLTNTIEQKPLKGGYVTASYKTHVNDQVLVPYARYQFYEGGKKHELDARSYKVSDVEIGMEWLPYKNIEFTAAYMISDRTFEDGALKSNHQMGNTLRLQAQMMF